MTWLVGGGWQMPWVRHINRLLDALDEVDKVRDELKQAHTCLEEYGDVDYDMMTQGGNQGLRHVDQALALLADKED